MFTCHALGVSSVILPHADDTTVETRLIYNHITVYAFNIFHPKTKGIPPSASALYTLLDAAVAA
jgi:hypothetical protein